MSKSENSVSSDLLKKVSNLIESVTYQENSFIFNHELLRRYGPGSRQTFIKVPKSKTAYSREDIFGHAERQAPTLCFGINTCFLEEFVRQLQSRACFKNHKLLTMMVFS